MANGTHTVVCARCNVPLQGNVVDTQPQDRFACPSCGTGDTYKNVMREVKEAATDQIGDALAKTLKAAVRGNDFVTFKEKRRPKKRRRFIANLDHR